MPKLLQALQMHDVVVHGDLPGLVPATEDDWSKEYLTLDVALKVVKDLDAAVEHIDQYGTGHTEAIVTSDLLGCPRVHRSSRRCGSDGQRVDCLHRR